jgi:hypothetical protein
MQLFHFPDCVVYIHTAGYQSYHCVAVDYFFSTNYTGLQNYNFFLRQEV